MNIGRSEYTRLIQQEVKLNKIKKLLKRIRTTLVVNLKEYDDLYRDVGTIEKILEEDGWRNEVILIKEIDKILEE